MGRSYGQIVGGYRHVAVVNNGVDFVKSSGFRGSEKHIDRHERIFVVLGASILHCYGIDLVVNKNGGGDFCLY